MDKTALGALLSKVAASVAAKQLASSLAPTMLAGGGAPPPGGKRTIFKPGTNTPLSGIPDWQNVAPQPPVIPTTGATTQINNPVADSGFSLPGVDFNQRMLNLLAPIAADEAGNTQVATLPQYPKVFEDGSYRVPNAIDPMNVVVKVKGPDGKEILLPAPMLKDALVSGYTYVEGSATVLKATGPRVGYRPE